MKTKITVRAIGSIVYFLTSTGFKKGTIKNVHILSNDRCEYRVTCKDFDKEYMGDRKVESELFDSQKEMVTHYVTHYAKKKL